MVVQRRPAQLPNAARVLLVQPGAKGDVRHTYAEGLQSVGERQILVAVRDKDVVQSLQVAVVEFEGLKKRVRGQR